MSDEEPAPRVVVRVRTSVFARNGGLTFQRDIYPLKRQCEGHEFFGEDISMSGADLTLEKTLNALSVKDGLYEVRICNVKKDWETGTVDDYDFELVPIRPATAHSPP